MMGVKNRTEVCLLLLIYVVFWCKNLDSIISGPQRTVQGQFMTPLIKVYHFCIKKVLNCSIDHKYWIYLEGLVCVSHVSMGWMKRNRRALFIRNKPICEWLARWPVTRLCSITSVRINLWSSLSSASAPPESFRNHNPMMNTGGDVPVFPRSPAWDHCPPAAPRPATAGPDRLLWAPAPLQNKTTHQPTHPDRLNISQKILD